MFRVGLLLVVLIAQDCTSQDDEEGPYKGKLIGKFNSYHHQVSGDVYAVDDWTLLLVNLNYDGTGDDTFFWAGDSGRPGPQGFIIPDQHGKTNVLEKYYNDEIRISLPEGKRISRLKWISVYDIATQNAFADVFVPEEFSPPAPRALPPLTPAPHTAGVTSGPLTLLDANTILLSEFRLSGAFEAYFITGQGPQPSGKGSRIPDEYGYLEPLRNYRGDDVTLTLPAGTTVFDIDWLAVYDEQNKQVLAWVLIPEAVNVPPGVLNSHPHRSQLPHCRQLHRDYQVAWEVFGSQVTVQLAAKISENGYMAFGISGSASESRMLGADAAVASFDARLQQGRATDYNITDMAPCVQVLGAWRGVCRDDRVGGLDSNQVFSASRQDGVTVVTYRRSLQPAESIDLAWPTDRLVAVVWALGDLDGSREPAFHHTYHKRDLLLNLTGPAHDNDCVPFTVGTLPPSPSWEPALLSDPSVRVFTLTVGGAGGSRGPSARGRPRTALALYVNGQLAPDVQLRRGLTYTFRLFTGNDPHSAQEYHPVMITSEPRGGLETLTEAEQRAAQHSMLAGVHYTRRARPSPAAAGPLCIGTHTGDRRRADDYLTFREYNRSLTWRCAGGAPALLAVAPNQSWPDIVYYHSFTHKDMGGRIFIVDRHKRTVGRRGAGHASAPGTLALATLALATLTLATLTLACGFLSA